MRDPHIYSETNRWSDGDSGIADAIVRACRAHSGKESVVNAVVTALSGQPAAEIERVWERMQHFPFVFEIAEASGMLDTLALDGSLAPTSAIEVKMSHVLCIISGLCQSRS